MSPEDAFWASLLDDFLGPPVWTVQQITEYVHDLLREADDLRDLWVRGEVTQISRPRSGHVYLTLREDEAVLKVVMWRVYAERQARHFWPRQGETIEAHGYIDVYPRGGTYQFYADVLRPVGEGDLYAAFLRLKARLEAEGLFAAERKRPLPRFPRRIGVVTSATGAALRDILNTLRRRYPLAEVVLAASPVQGDEAPQALAEALQRLNRVAHPDVILLARGGGSAEDLAAFNTEVVVRAVAASDAPVITGVGHETDTTLVDLAADRRAATPTAAAELATPHREDLARDVQRLGALLQRRLVQYLTNAALHLAQVERRLWLHAPWARVAAARQRLTYTQAALPRALQQRLGRERARLAGLAARLARAAAPVLTQRRRRLEQWQARLQAAHPLAPLWRGYALVTDEAGRVVHDASQTRPGQRLHLRLARGRLDVRVETVHSEAEDALLPSSPNRRPPHGNG